MSDEKVIMDKGDYHKICDILKNIEGLYMHVDIEIGIGEVKDLLDKAEPYDETQKVSIHTTVIPARPMQVQCTLHIGNEEPRIFSDGSKLDDELKRRCINKADIKYFHDNSEGDE